MENLVIEHKEKVKTAIGYLAVTLVLAAVLLVAGDQFVMSVGTVLLILALVIELYMGISTLIYAFSKDIFTREGITFQNMLGSKTYLWKNLERFEILWDYEGRRLVKKEEVDAPYILLKFANPKKKCRFDYLEAIDQHIRACYGEPHVDNWTNIGK